MPKRLPQHRSIRAIADDVSPDTKNYWIRILLQELADNGLPAPLLEQRVVPGRQFRADLCWPNERLVFEFEGGVYARAGARRCPVCKQVPVGRHLTGTGFEGDIEKYNLYMLNGYRLLRGTTNTVKRRQTIREIAAALGKPIPLSPLEQLATTTRRRPRQAAPDSRSGLTSNTDIGY